MSTITQVVDPYTKVPNINSPATFNTDVNTFLNEINTRVTQTNTQSSQMNTVAGEVNTNASKVSSDKTAVEGWKNETLAARDEAVGAVATLPDGIINDGTTSPTDTWSSNKINTELSTKRQKYTAVTKTANYTALAYEYINCDVSGGGFTITLPNTPSALDEVIINNIDTTNTLTVDGGTINLKGVIDTTLEINSNIELRFIYANSEWRVS